MPHAAFLQRSEKSIRGDVLYIYIYGKNYATCGVFGQMGVFIEVLVTSPMVVVGQQLVRRHAVFVRLSLIQVLERRFSSSTLVPPAEAPAMRSRNVRGSMVNAVKSSAKASHPVCMFRLYNERGTLFCRYSLTNSITVLGLSLWLATIPPSVLHKRFPAYGNETLAHKNSLGVHDAAEQSRSRGTTFRLKLF